MPALAEALVTKLRAMGDRLSEIDRLLASPEIAKDARKIRELGRERRGLVRPVELFREWEKIGAELREAQELVDDPDADEELRNLAESEIRDLREREEVLARKIQEALVLEDSDHTRDVIVEIRAGTGGEEAALFAADLFEMYNLYAQRKGWKVEILSENKTDLGGFKEIVFSVRGENVYRYLRFESGTHRVQRVPRTEAGGRIHTSAATVAVLPEVEDVEIDLKDEDLKIETFCASGPGGQHVNKTSSAVRITHIPTGTVVSCQDEKSQHRNKSRALTVLKTRLYQARKQEQEQEIASRRREQIGSGDRAEKIRTYNFPQSRVTDHRAGISKYNLEEILHGSLDEIIEPLMEWDKEQRLKNL